MKRFPNLIIILAIVVMACGRLVAQNADTTENLPTVLLPGLKIVSSAPTGEHVFSESTVSKTDIERNIGNGSVNNLFDRATSMVTTSDAGTGVGYTYMRIRGIDHTRINVTINGITFNDAESQGSWFVNAPDLASKVQYIDIQRGAGTSNNGASAFGASMNFVTLTPSSTPYVQLSSSAGSFYTFRNSISAGTGIIKNRFSADISYSNILSRGYIEHASAKLHSLFFTADYRILNEKKNKEYGRLKFNLIYGNEKTGLAWNGVPYDSLNTNRRYNSCGEYYDENGNHQYYENQTDNYQQTHYQLHYEWDKKITEKQKIQLHAALHLTRGKGYYEEYQDDTYAGTYGLSFFPTDEFGNESTMDAITRKCMDNYFYGGIFNFSHTINRNFTWTVGGAVNRYDGKEFGTLEWLQYNVNVGKSAHWYDGTGDKRQYNVYGKVISTIFHSYSPHKTLMYADLQYRCIDYRIGGTNANMLNVAQTYKWHFLNPKVGVAHTFLTKIFKHELYYNFSVANREPTRSDLTESDIENRPKPETMYDFELGYLLKDYEHKNLTISVDGYFMYYRDQLVLTGEINSVGAAVMTNTDKSFRTGLEFSVAYQPLKWLQWNVNGNFSMNKILDYTEYVDDWDTGEQREKHIGTTNISFSPNIVINNELLFTPVKNFDISFVTKFVSRQYIDNSSRKEYSIDPYCVNNLQLSYKIATKPIPEIGLFFQINNIFNAKYESNAWLYRYYLGGEECRMDGYNTQAGINFMGGITLKW